MRFIILLLLFSTTSYGANFNKKSTPIINEPINFIVPSDVLSDFAKGSDADKKRFCSTSSNSLDLIRDYASGRKEVPQLIKGYNSRMDNERDVPFADETGLFILRMSEVVTDAWVFNDDEKKETALEALHQWALQGGLLKTKSCTRNGMLDQGCTQWTQPDGQDLSDSKDFATVQMWVMKLANGYYFGLADFKAGDPRHKVIQNWLSEFFKRNKKANKVYFGLDHGWFYPAILDKLRQSKSPKSLVKKLLKELDKQVYDDGSMKDRTTRGNRALWYHHDAVKEAMVSIEIARVIGVEIPEKLNAKMSNAGAVFVNGYFDHSSLDKWAKEAHNAVYEPGKQDFKNKLNHMANGHSWFYIFSYRNPNDPITKQLDDIIRQADNQAVKDGQIGFGLGCIYAVAKSEQGLAQLEEERRQAFEQKKSENRARLIASAKKLKSTAADAKKAAQNGLDDLLTLAKYNNSAGRWSVDSAPLSFVEFRSPQLMDIHCCNQTAKAKIDGRVIASDYSDSGVNAAVDSLPYFKRFKAITELIETDDAMFVSVLASELRPNFVVVVQLRSAIAECGRMQSSKDRIVIPVTTSEEKDIELINCYRQNFAASSQDAANFIDGLILAAPGIANYMLTVKALE